jgi:PHP family Zn ribbon phosphoesterase
MICNDCHSLVDVITQTKMPGIEDMVGKCPACKSAAVEPWDPVNQPCPKCGKSMKKGPLTAFWD